MFDAHFVMKMPFVRDSQKVIFVGDLDLLKWRARDCSFAGNKLEDKCLSFRDLPADQIVYLDRDLWPGRCESSLPCTALGIVLGIHSNGNGDVSGCYFASLHRNILL